MSAVVAFVVIFGGATTVILTTAAPAQASTSDTRADKFGTLEVSGSDWLGGYGVSVYFNGSSADDDSGVNDYVKVGTTSVLAGEEWQCVEFVNRLYLTRGWTTSTWTGNGNQLYANAPSSLTKEANGSITYLNPGDVVTLDDGGFGHAGIVDSVSGSTVTIINQNTFAVYSSATRSNKTLTMSGWAGYTVQGVIHRPKDWSPTGEPSSSDPSSTVQMLIDGANQVWAEDGSPTNGWTQEAPSGETAISAGGDGLQMILDSTGVVWAKSAISTGGWIPETPTGEIAMSAGGSGLQMILDHSGNVWAKSTIGNGGWTQETAGGVTAIAAGYSGLQLILNTAGQVWAKASIGFGGWTQETPSGEAAIATGASGQQMILDSVGQVWAKTGVANGGWIPETPTGERVIATD